MTRAISPRPLAADQWREQLHELMPIGDGAQPDEVLGWYRDGRLTRVRADYPNGWRLQFCLSPKGMVNRLRASVYCEIRRGA